MTAKPITLLAAAWIIIHCGAPVNKHARDAETTPSSTQEKVSLSDVPTSTTVDIAIESTARLDLTLTDATSNGHRKKRVRQVTGDPIDNGVIRDLLSRSTPLVSEKTDTQVFSFKKSTRKPPRPGDEISMKTLMQRDAALPPEVSTAPLDLVRFAPEGQVDVVPHLSVTFSQSMVPVGRVDTTAAHIPATIDPMPTGTWQWIGTRTALFKPTPRFAKATHYTVTIPKNTTSIHGQTLSQTTRFRFSTPPIRITRAYPTETGHGPNEPFFIEFDQEISPSTLFPYITCKAGNTPIYLDRITDENHEAMARITDLISEATPNRWIALLPSAPLPPATDVTLTIKKGAPSAEGPRLTSTPQHVRYRTYDPFVIEDSTCGWQDTCRPTDDWHIRFNNPIDTNTIDAEDIVISPSLSEARVIIDHAGIRISGTPKGQTTYVVSLPDTMRDTFNQRLTVPSRLRFQVSRAAPSLRGPNRDTVTLDPSGPAILRLYAINLPTLNLQVNHVTPEDWTQWHHWKHNKRHTKTTDRAPAMPGRVLQKDAIDTPHIPDTVVPVDIDLQKWTQRGYSHFGIHLSPASHENDSRDHRDITIWVQVTQLGISAFRDDDKLLAWTTDLQTGVPLEGVTVRLLNDDTVSVSDEVGMCRFDKDINGPSDSLLIATRNGDVAILPGIQGWSSSSKRNRLPLYSFDDRHIYKPGDTVHIKGWIRLEDDDNLGVIADSLPPITTVSWTLNDPRGSSLDRGTVPLTSRGGFYLKTRIPNDANLGTARVRFFVDEDNTSITGGWHTFSIQEYRTPEYEVTTWIEDGPHTLGETITAAVFANYFAGGGLPDADVSWTLNTQDAQYAPPNTTGFHFGRWHPWWRHVPPHNDHHAQHRFSGHTDKNGHHRLSIHLRSMKHAYPMSITAAADVQDINRQSWSATSSFIVHPADVYVGIKSDAAFVAANETADYIIRTVDINGTPVDGAAVTVDFKRMDWNGNEMDASTDHTETCRFVSSGTDHPCRFTPTRGGIYEVNATVRDIHDRRNTTTTRLWVTGDHPSLSYRPEQKSVTIIPDNDTYHPGDTASILIQSPFYPANGVLLVKKGKILHRTSFSMNGPTTTRRVRIEDRHMPGCSVQVTLTGAAERTDDRGQTKTNAPRRPAYATGEIELKVPPHKRRLNVDALVSDTTAAPGDTVTVAVHVSDHQGAPATGAEVAVVVVDEAVLALSNYMLTDPMSVFYQTAYFNGRTYHTRDHLLLRDADHLNGADDNWRTADTLDYRTVKMSESASMDASGGLGHRRSASPSATSPIATRQDFSATAHFSPAVNTDKNGKATVRVTLPDSLTRYRIIAVAAHEVLFFGTGESQITVRLPLMVRPSAPRFLNVGDQFKLPVVLQNQTHNPMAVTVAVDATNLRLNDHPNRPVGRRVTIPANDRIELQFDAETTAPGTARLHVVATADNASDAARISIPVRTPALHESFATYGTIDDHAVLHRVEKPTDVYEAVGGLDVSTSSTQLQTLTDAFLYLLDYPFTCSEQLASRLIAIATLTDVLEAFDTTNFPAASRLNQVVIDTIEILKRRQGPDGGFGMWHATDNRWPYMSVHVTMALVLARKNGYAIPDDMMQNAMEYLDTIESTIPTWYSKKSKGAILAYAINVQHRSGRDVSTKAQSLLNQSPLSEHAMETLGWILPALHDVAPVHSAALLRHAGNHVAESANAAHFATSYSDGAHVLMHSDRRVDGIWLDALIDVSPNSDLLPKLLQGLLKHRKRGRWQSTQENSVILVALRNYFNTFEAIDPDFVTRIWLGNRLAGEHAFQGRTAATATLTIPHDRLQADNRLILEKDGQGRMYYRIGIRYTPRQLHRNSENYGFAITRTYEPVDAPSDVVHLADGTVVIKAGARVRIRLNMVAPMRRYHVALVDPLPAGFEIINPALAVHADIDQSKTPSSRLGSSANMGAWYEHQNMRDERIEAFASVLFSGVYEYVYTARATTPGKFIVPAAKAEEMYTPETFGHSATDTVIISD